MPVIPDADATVNIPGDTVTITNNGTPYTLSIGSCINFIKNNKSKKNNESESKTIIAKITGFTRDGEGKSNRILIQNWDNKLMNWEKRTRLLDHKRTGLLDPIYNPRFIGLAGDYTRTSDNMGDWRTITIVSACPTPTPAIGGKRRRRKTRKQTRKSRKTRRN